MAHDDLLVAAKGGGAVFAGRLFAWGSRFVLAILLARVLGADDYGLYTLALTIATVGSSFAILGLDAALVRFGAVFAGRGDRAGLRGTIRIGVLVPAAISVGMGIAFVVASDWIATTIVGQPAVAPLLRVVGVLVPALVLNQQLAATLQGMRRIHQAVIAEQFAQQTLRFVLLLGLTLIGLTAETALVASTIAAFGVTFVLLWFVRRATPRRDVAVPAEHRPGMLMRFSLPVYFSNVVNTLGGNLQTLFLGAMASLTAVGIFSVAAHIQLIGSIFHSAVVSSSMPVFAALHDRGDRAGMTRLYQTTSRWTLTLNLPFFLAALIFPQFLLAIFGKEFEAGATALVILACGNLLNAATGSSGAVLDMSGYTIVKLLNATISVGLAIALNLLLIPSFGIIGAAIAAASAVGIVNLLRVVQVRILVGVSPYNRDFLKPIVAGFAAAAATLVVGVLMQPLAGWVQAGIGLLVLAGVYTGTIIALGITDDDRLVLDRVMRKLSRRGRRDREERRAARDKDKDVDRVAAAPASGERAQLP